MLALAYSTNHPSTHGQKHGAAHHCITQTSPPRLQRSASPTLRPRAFGSIEYAILYPSPTQPPIPRDSL
jgi:hypothetical protein